MSCKIIEKFHKLGRLDTNPQSCLTIDICVGYSYNKVLYTKGQSRINIPKTLTALGIQGTGRR
jgi:hypothetical protein